MESHNRHSPYSFFLCICVCTVCACACLGVSVGVGGVCMHIEDRGQPQVSTLFETGFLLLFNVVYARLADLGASGNFLGSSHVTEESVGLQTHTTTPGFA